MFIYVRASLMLTSNDIVANLVVMIAGVLVLLLHLKVPDLAGGPAVFILSPTGVLRILRSSK